MVDGPIAKLKGQLTTTHQVRYALPIGSQLIDLLPYIGQQLLLKYVGEISCVACGRKIKKSFQQGYCFPCTQKLAQCDLCIVRPERCHYHLGTCRQPDWADQHCMQAHYVYLANSSGLKVGITRGSNVPFRWIDQGASQALLIAQVANRRLAGLLEVAIAQYIADKTNWRKMLQGVPEAIDLISWRQRLLVEVEPTIAKLQNEFGEVSVMTLPDETVTLLDYPVQQYPAKISSHNFDKIPHVSGQLLGIKGQYLILNTGVLNVRKFSGYHVILGEA